MSRTPSFIEIKFQELKTEVNTFIKNLYTKSDVVLSVADPYGQILNVVEMIFSNAILNQKMVINQFDLNNDLNNNGKMVKLWARVAGYDPGRAVSATGTISLLLKPGINIPSTIPGSQITINNGTKIQNKTNNLNYFIDLGTDSITFNLQAGKSYYLPVVNGTVESQTFTGTGEKMQSLSVNLPNGQNMEQFRTVVSVNGVIWTEKTHLYDMLPNENDYCTRTGIEGGVDIYFGNSFYGAIPPIGSAIIVQYVISDGSLGSIPHTLVNDWTFVDEIYDGTGLSVDIEDNFNVSIEDEIDMGSDPETPQYTKMILPYTSRNFVLARPEQYIFLLKRMGIFSQIDVFTTQKGSPEDNGDNSDDSVVYIFLIPDITQFITGGSSYFDLSLSAFTLNTTQQNKIITYLKTLGTIALGNSIKIFDPIINKYAINIFLRVFDTADQDNVRNSILSSLSTFFGNLQRTGRISKSDIITLLDPIDGINTIDATFISANNEAYHLNYNNYQKSVMLANPKMNPANITLNGYNPNNVIGLDPLLGDIIYKKNELPIIRGGWKDRNGISYQETPQPTGFSSVNISIVGVDKKVIFGN